MRNSGPVARSPQSSKHIVSTPESTNLADLLERVLDKGIVIAGDITISLAAVELLTIKLRLLVASIDKAQEIGINWWQSDPFLSSRAREQELASRTKDRESEGERKLLTERLDRLERLLLAPPQKANQERAQEPEAARPRGHQPQKAEQPQAQQPKASPAEQSAPARTLLVQALQ